MSKKENKLRRKRIVRDFQCYHEPLVTASRYVKSQTEGMFKEIYMETTECWDTCGLAAVSVCVMWNGKKYSSNGRCFNKNEFDNMYKRGIHPEIYCRAVLTAEVFDLYAKLFSQEGMWRK